MLVIAVVGDKDSGKTTLIERVCRELGKKFRIGVIKHIHHKGASFDVKGTDTWRVKESGAYAVMGLAPDKFFFHVDGSIELKKAIEIMENWGMDLVILEGFRGMISGAYTILVSKKPELPANFLPDAVYMEDFEDTSLNGLKVLRNIDEVKNEILRLIG